MTKSNEHNRGGVIDMRTNMPINLAFARSDDGKLGFAFNNAAIPDVRILREALELLRVLVKGGRNLVNRLNIQLEIQREIEYVLSPGIENEGKRPVAGYVYFLRSLDLYKIGRCRDLIRLKAYTTENPHGIKVLAIQQVSDYAATEKMLLETHKSYKHRGEWFNFTEQMALEIAQSFAKL